ncbi:hypothetical protein F5Y03DRAFT_406819 [Xylaria venustula]|nr:hypothetical protein F5Y03DRAFT_406819 [Xylaria venustula]
MCRYRRSMFLCNHSQLSAAPQWFCSAQRDYVAGKSDQPCDEVGTHTCSTIRVPQLCVSCGTRKATLDQRLSEVKSKMAELKQHLNESYGECVKHVFEAGLESEVKTKGDEKDSKKADPVAEFLKMKRSEKHANLMMLGN